MPLRAWHLISLEGDTFHRTRLFLEEKGNIYPRLLILQASIFCFYVSLPRKVFLVK